MTLEIIKKKEKQLKSAIPFSSFLHLLIPFDRFTTLNHRLPFMNHKIKNKMGFVNLLVFLIFSVLLNHCSSSNTTNATEGDDGNTTERSVLLQDVNSWTYQLQNVVVNDIASSAFDLAVIDYSSDGSDEEAFSSDNVSTMKGSGSSAKLVLAYMSIGEAEDYRYYFDASASYVDEENPDWPGNYKVHYWDDAWQTIIEGYVDRLIHAGFDGAYLDIIDAYEYYGPGGDSGLERTSAADDMVNLVTHIADYARMSDENFLIFPQNGSGIINDSSLADDYLSAIDGIGAEDTFYYGNENEDNDLDEQSATIVNLDAFSVAGKTILSVDYLTDLEKIDNFYDLATARDYIPYATVRDLDALTVNSGHEPN